jgi:ribonuclease Y
VPAPSVQELDDARREAADIRARADADAAEFRRAAEAAAAHALAARDDAESEARALKDDLREQRLDLERREHRLAEREERLDGEGRQLEERAAELARTEAEIAAKRAELEDVEEERRLILERTAGMTTEQAKAELVAAVENQAKRDAAVLVRDIEAEARTEGENRPARSSPWPSNGWRASRPPSRSSASCICPATT